MPIIPDPATGDTLLTLRTELQARGYEYLDTTRANRFINWAVWDLCQAQPWPFLEATETGVPPLAITDVRSVLSVNDSTTLAKLPAVHRDQVIGTYGTLATVGTPGGWYMENTTLKTYPVGTDTMTVYYLKIPAELAADADVCVVPKQYSDVVVDGAVLKALKDDESYAQDFPALRSEYDRRVLEMAGALLQRDGTDPDYVEVRNVEAWA